MMNQEHKRPVTLEDLLRLKRAERPAAEFWNQFDRELRAKQLAAIVEKRPWWRTFPRAFGSLSRYHLPLGATAILALTVLTVREYRSPIASPAAEENKIVATTATAPSVSGEALVAHSVLPARLENAVANTENDASADSATFVLASEATSSGELAQMIPVLGAAPHAFEREVMPAARFIATNLALAKATEPVVAQNLLGASHGFEARALPPKTPVVEPLSQMALPSDVRRSPLLNGAVMSVSMNTSVPAHAPAVRSRRLSDEQLYDTVSRFDPHGNSFGVKF